MGQNTNDKSKDVQNLKSKTSSNDDEKQNKKWDWKILTSVISSVIAVVTLITNVLLTLNQINNSQKENTENNIFQVATKITEDRIVLNTRYEDYTNGNLLLSPQKVPKKPLNNLICIENISSTTALNVNIKITFDDENLTSFNDNEAWYFTIPKLSPGQKFYIDNTPKTYFLKKIDVQCSSPLNETLQLKYSPFYKNSIFHSLPQVSETYYDNKIYIHDLNKLNNIPNSSNYSIKPYTNFKNISGDNIPNLYARYNL